MTASKPDFDCIARAYRWLEYLSLGTALERTRRFHLDSGLLDRCHRALVLGDGDGRFTAWLLRRNLQVRVDAIDLSGAMLRLLQRRCEFAADRLTIQQADVRAFLTPDKLRAGSALKLSADRTLLSSSVPSADLVITHFFLDSLTDTEVRLLVQRIAPALAPNARWLVSEFRVPNGWLKWPALALVRGLYFAFHLLTGLRVNRLPDHAAALREADFHTLAEKHLLGGILTAQLWQKGS